MISRDDIDAFTPDELQSAATLATVADRIIRGTPKFREGTRAEFIAAVHGGLVWRRAFIELAVAVKKAEASRADGAAFDGNNSRTS